MDSKKWDFVKEPHMSIMVKLRGVFLLPKIARRDTEIDKLKVEVVGGNLNMPEEKIARLSELVWDYYILVPDDAKAKKAIRTPLRLEYGRY
ncbi:hypothetical protein MKW98_003673 [Papaver atlanticum]|uniref:Uncharacterized protein n=1 Tax=Papaver atlanticum TaxID=357466 RepID=A0AAD4SJT7_9MAGN|nr:hypothetical protein MKW98_003673 [Papaver atlanticum]